MLTVTCRGSPFELGCAHGAEAKEQIKRCIAFYADVFQDAADMQWSAVVEQAKRFQSSIQDKWPHYYEEMRGKALEAFKNPVFNFETSLTKAKGIAYASSTDTSDIIALNVRTEIMFGLHSKVSDGCTSFAWCSSGGSFIGQNWDWMERQRDNLVFLTVEQPGKPTIKMITEAGIIGKIGMNSAGVGVCLNAIKVGGVDASRIPCHLGLRAVLECNTREEAVHRLQDVGVASACHMLVADEHGAVGLEWSTFDLQILNMNGLGQVFHSNHYIVEHPGLNVKPWLADSDFRLDRIEKLCNGISGNPTTARLSAVLEDEKNFPAAICRVVDDSSDLATLFSIVMDLSMKKALIRVGRPSAPQATIDLAF